MTKPLELTGQRFGRLVVACQNPVNYNNHSRWDCICDCGKHTTVVGSKLINGRTTSCGCFHMERLRESLVTHGMYGSVEYEAWAGMKCRCYNPKRPEYARYGGRGITVCERWQNSFEAFYADMGPRPSDDHSIDRWPDNDGNYEPGNCRWATSTQQANNRRSSTSYVHNGVTKTIADLAKEYGLPYSKLYKRLNDGLSLEEALSAP